LMRRFHAVRDLGRSPFRVAAEAVRVVQPTMTASTHIPSPMSGYARRSGPQVRHSFATRIRACREAHDATRQENNAVLPMSGERRLGIEGPAMSVHRLALSGMCIRSWQTSFVSGTLTLQKRPALLLQLARVYAVKILNRLVDVDFQQWGVAVALCEPFPKLQYRHSLLTTRGPFFQHFSPRAANQTRQRNPGIWGALIVSGRL
jgi:hypothetical protein